MKPDTTTTVMQFTLATLVVLGVIFAVLGIMHSRQLRKLQPNLQVRSQIVQVNLMKAQSLAGDVAAYNATAKSPELAKILQSVMTSPQAAPTPAK